MSTLYADLSHHDWDRAKGELDFKAILAATSGAICLRATYGDPKGVHYPTQHFGDMTRAAQKAGFSLLGAYHNLVKGDQASINRQVDWLRSEMDRYGSTWAMLDVERYDELIQADNHPRWDDVQQFHDRWYAVDKRVLAFYIPDWVWNASLGSHPLTGLRGPLVSSEYGTNPSGATPARLYAKQGGDTSALWHPYGGRTPDILQYGSHCACPGASANTDVNAYRGTFAQLTALLSPTKPQEDGMEQKDLLAEKTAFAKRTIGDHFADDQNLRDWQYAKPGATTVNPPPPGSRLVGLYEDVAAIRAGVAQLLTSTGEEIDLAGVVNGVVAGLAQQLNSAEFAARVADAIPEDLAEELLDALSRRIAERSTLVAKTAVPDA